MKVVWITSLPMQVQCEALNGEDHGARHAAPWIIAHLPPPPGIDLHLACLWPGGFRQKEFVYQGATFHLIPCPRHGRLATLYLFDTHFYKSLFCTLNPDIVHGWGTEESNGMVAVRVAPRRHIVGIHGVMNVINARGSPTLRDHLSATLERLTLAFARHVVAESVSAAEAAGRLCRRTKPLVVPHPVRAEILAADPGDRLRKTAVFLGRIAVQKGIRDAVESFARAAPQDWNLKIIGGGSVKERDALKASLEACRLTGRAVHVENLSGGEVTSVLQEASMLILPTLADSGPTALKEALCMGVWPVCYDNTGPGELIRAFKYGMLARDRDIQHLAECLRQSFADEPWGDTLRRTACITQARTLFSPQRAWQCLTALYQEVLK